MIAAPAMASIDGSEHGSTINVVTWFLLVATTLAVITRLATKLAISHRLNTDDFVVFSALLLCTGQSVAVSIQARLNRPINTLDVIQLERFQKSTYASGLLYIPSLLLAKLSVSLLLRLITPNILHKKLILGVEIVTVFWAVSSEIAAAFQCHLPVPWKFLGGNTCFDRTAFWTYFGIMNIVTDLAFVLLPFGIVWKLQVTAARKVVVAGCFASRIVVVTAIAVQIVYLNRESGSQDPSLNFWPTAICTQAVLNLSIITACIPYLKPFFESLESGMIRSDDLRRRGIKLPYGSGSGKSAGSTILGSGKAPSRVAKSPDVSHELGQMSPNTGNFNFGHQANSTTITATMRDDWDDGSDTSQSKIIRQTTTWAVNAEP